MANIFRRIPSGRLGSASAFISFNPGSPKDEIANEFWEYTAPAGGITTKVNIGGVWKDVTARYVNIGGTWKTVTAVSTNIGGVWKNEA